MTPKPWAFEIGDRFRLQVGDDMEGVEFAIVSRDTAHGMRTYLLVCCDPDCQSPPMIETEGMLSALREVEALLG